jgi:hypothetical protein
LRYKNDVQVIQIVSFDAYCGWDLIYVFDAYCGWNLSYTNCLRKWHVDVFMFYEEIMC